jgi:protein SCO1/2
MTAGILPRPRLDGDQRFALGGFLAWFGITAAWWALAFAPLPVPGPWLAAARRVCFGTLPNGLPEPWGWMLLALAPAAILSFLIAVWGRDLVAAFRLASRRASFRMLLGVLAIVTAGGLWDVGDRLLAASRSGQAFDSTLEPFPDGYPRTALAAPALALIDQTGAPFDLAQLRGRPVLLTFAYGHCPTICPILTNAIRDARREYTGGQPPPAVVVTLDPWRDTPSALPSLARSWSLDAAGGGYLLSGPVDTVVAAAEAWEVGFSRDERSGAIAHAGITFVLDAEGRIAYKFLGPPAHWLIEAARRLEPA